MPVAKPTSLPITPQDASGRRRVLIPPSYLLTSLSKGAVAGILTFVYTNTYIKNIKNNLYHLYTETKKIVLGLTCIPLEVTDKLSKFIRTGTLTSSQSARV